MKGNKKPILHVPLDKYIKNPAGISERNNVIKNR